MPQAIMVQENGNGYYEIIGDRPEDWEFVQGQVDRVERIESLTGWPPYTAAYRLSIGTLHWTYFAEEE